MKKKIVVLGICTLMLCGCGKTIPKLSNGDEAVVKLENGEMISVNDLYEELKNNYALESLINIIDKKILENKYKDEIENANNYADSTMKSLEKNFGENLLSAIQSYTNFTTIEAYKNYVYISYLENLAIEDYAKSLITNKEIEKYYKDNIYGDVLVSHILITSKATSSSTTEEKNNAEKEAKDKVNTIIAKLKESKDVKETFAALAKEYSEDESTKENGGSLGYINNGTLSSNYDELIKKALELKNGEFSTEVITTELGYHVIFRQDQKEKAKLEDVKDSIIETLSKKLLSEDATISIKATQNLRKDHGLEIVDSELQKQYANYIQNALTKAQSSNSNKN